MERMRVWEMRSRECDESGLVLFFPRVCVPALTARTKGQECYCETRGNRGSRRESEREREREREGGKRKNIESLTKDDGRRTRAEHEGEITEKHNMHHVSIYHTSSSINVTRKSNIKNKTPAQIDTGRREIMGCPTGKAVPFSPETEGANECVGSLGNDLLQRPQCWGGTGPGDWGGR